MREDLVSVRRRSIRNEDENSCSMYELSNVSMIDNDMIVSHMNTLQHNTLAKVHQVQNQIRPSLIPVNPSHLNHQVRKDIRVSNKNI